MTDDITALARKVLDNPYNAGSVDMHLARAVLELHAETKEQDEMMIQACRENVELREQLNQAQEENERHQRIALLHVVESDFKEYGHHTAEWLSLRDLLLKDGGEQKEFLNSPEDVFRVIREGIWDLELKLEQAQEGWEEAGLRCNECGALAHSRFKHLHTYGGCRGGWIPLYRRKGASMPKGYSEKYIQSTAGVPTPDTEGGDASMPPSSVDPNYVTQGRTGGESQGDIVRETHAIIDAAMDEMKLQTESQGLVTDEMVKTAARAFWAKEEPVTSSGRGVLQATREALEAVAQDIYEAGMRQAETILNTPIDATTERLQEGAPSGAKLGMPIDPNKLSIEVMPDGRSVGVIRMTADERSRNEIPELVIDFACNSCTEQKVGTYELPMVCSNCWHSGIGRFSQGHEALAEKCPNCGTLNLRPNWMVKHEGR